MLILFALNERKRPSNIVKFNKAISKTGGTYDFKRYYFS